MFFLWGENIPANPAIPAKQPASTYGTDPVHRNKPDALKIKLCYICYVHHVMEKEIPVRVYFDKFGREVSENEATDFRGMLKDGFGIRHHISMMDSAAAINDASAWAKSPVGAAALAREEMIARLNGRPARMADALFAEAKAAADAQAKAAPIRDAQAATAAAMAREARAAMIARFNSREAGA